MSNGVRKLVDQAHNSSFLLVLKKHLVTDSFGYEHFPEQKQLLQLALDFYFPAELSWQKTCQRLTEHQAQQSAVFAKEWLSSLHDFYALYLFWDQDLSLSLLFSTELLGPSSFVLFLRKQLLKNFNLNTQKLDDYFSNLLVEINYQDIDAKKLRNDLQLSLPQEELGKIYNDCLPELEPRSVIKYSEAIRGQINTSGFSGENQKVGWNLLRNEERYWQSFLLQMIILFIITVILFLGIKQINHYYEKLIIEKITLLEPNFLWLDTKLTFKSETDVPQKEIKLSSTQIDELEKLERVEQSKFQVTEFLPESDILDTSVAIGGWGGGFVQSFSAIEEDTPNIGNEYRDIYDGFSRSYRLMLNSADLFDMRKKLISIFRYYNVKEANIPIVGKESLDGVYFNVFIPSNKIQSFISELSGMETTNTYISKTVHRPPQGYERVFIWVKRI